MRSVGFVVAVLWLALSGGAQAQSAGETSAAVLTVVGAGAVEAEPDMATLRLGISHEAGTAAEALDEVGRRAGEVLTLISEIGIAPADVQTTGLSLSPVWRDVPGGTRDAPQVVGYRASTDVTLRVRELLDLGVIVDDLVASGANRFDGVEFGLQEATPVMDAARRAAVADARRKAQLYAEAAGLELGAIRAISEPRTHGVAPQFGIEAVMMERSAMPMAAGSLELRAEITLIYELVQP